MKKYIYNFNWLFLDKFIKLACSLFIGIWVARYLGPNDFGILSFASAFISFFAFTAGGGLQSIAVRDLVKYPDKLNVYMGTIASIMFVGAIVSILFVLIGIKIFKPDESLLQLIVFISSLVFLFQAFNVINFFFQSQILSKYSVFSTNIALLISMSLKVVFILTKQSVIYFAIAIIIDSMFTAMCLIYFYKKCGYSLRYWKFDKGMAISLLKDSWPLAISTLLITIHKSIDQIMIEDMMNFSEVGLYSVSVRLSAFWYFIPAIIGSTLMPYFVSLRDVDKKNYYRMLMGLSSLLFWFAICIALFFTLFAEDIVILLFSNAYIGSADALVWSVWGGIFLAMGVPWAIWQVAENLQFYRLYAQIMCVVLNISLNLLLIPQFGIAGAAFTTTMTYLFGTWIFGQFFTPIRPAIRMMIRSSNPVYMIQFCKYILAKGRG